MALKTDDLRIIEMQELSTPDEVRGELPVTENDAKNILLSRNNIERTYWMEKMIEFLWLSAHVQFMIQLLQWIMLTD